MSTYLFLDDHYIGGIYYQLGSFASTADVGGTLPIGWVPTAMVDPQDAAATMAFWNAGVQLPGLIRARWVGINQPTVPITYWVLKPPIGSILTDERGIELTDERGNPLTTDIYNRIAYVLTGLGASLGSKILV